MANQVDPLQNMADLISRHGSAATHVAVLTAWLLATTIAGTIVTRRRALT